jgi:uncharacterized phage infection (PIP) family protein YhgE
MHSESVIPTTERRSLRYDFSAPEIYELSLRLANKHKEVTRQEEEKKSVVSQYAAKINELKASINNLSNNVSEGYEFREVECTVEFNKPETGKKTLTRKDNQQTIVERMENWEFNLFTQVTADDGLGNFVPPQAGTFESPKKERKRRGKKESTDILDEVEGMTPPEQPKHYRDPDNEPLDDDDTIVDPDDLPFI